MAEQQDNDDRFFQSIHVEITYRVYSDETNFKDATKSFDINAESFQAMALDALAKTEELPGSPRCVVRTKSASEAHFTKREHFVPEGLGFDWTAPEPGVGTCDEVNARFGDYECEWLRQGQMGIFRPFFVADGKDGPPVYYAPNMKEKLVWFTREDDGARALNLSHKVKADLPDRGGPGEIVIRVPHNEARVVPVSLALHKMALLMFWLCEGPLAFDAAFTDLRRFLINPSETNYRSYVENMVVGASPGVDLHYLVVWRPVGEGKAEIETVQCGVRAHHMKYVVVLAGKQDTVPDALVEKLSWKPWADPKLKVPDHTAFAFGMSGFERKIL